MAEERKPGKRGPKPKFDVAKGYQRGAPRLATRVDPDVLEWIESRPEGTRPYIERVVREERERTLGGGSTVLTEQEELASEA